MRFPFEPAASGPAVRPLTTGIRRFFYFAAFIVTTAFVPLYIFSAQTDVGFAWTIQPPLTAAFLGAGYFAAFFLELGSSREREWSRARLGMTVVLLFTVLTFIATVLHFDRFHFESAQPIARFSAWAWLFLYTFTPIVMSTLIFLQIRVPGGPVPRGVPLPTWAKALMVAEAALFLPVGVLLFIAPTQIAPLWPWTLTPLTAQAIAAWVISIGFVAASTAWEGDVDRPPAIAALFALAVAQLLALARFQSDVDWSRPSAWVYLFSMTVLLATAVLAWAVLRRHREHSTITLQPSPEHSA